MTKNLVIVESPAKAKPIERYLGKNYKVTASVGHIKDLPQKSMGVDIENNFTPQYEIINGKNKVLSEIRKFAKNSDNIFLAMDPDREGEAIAFHLAEELSKNKKHIYRILFNEITKNAIIEAFSKPQELDRSKYNSQQARRILDRLVGYKISPILWDKVKRGLSAGRVQSVAVRIVVEREKEIKAFNSTEYWSITGIFTTDKHEFSAKLFKVSGKNPILNNESDAKKIIDESLKNKPEIDKIKKTSKKRNPSPPFITSTLQQEAARKLRFTAKKTMLLAQQLYEGIEIGEGEASGLITYMRTDSTRISETALEQTRAYIKKKYGNDFLPDKPIIYKQKKKGQDAHEAIRPTTFSLEPQKAKKFLTPDQYKVYSLIWNRFIACQMEPARFNLTTVDINVGKNTYRATGTVMVFPGFTNVYTEGTDVEAEAENEKILPEIEKNTPVKAKTYNPSQHFTQPPPRYTEASLIKELEEKGIGRPSTFATILSTIISKKYVNKEKNKLFPTDLGSLVTELLVKSFPQVLNIAFTAELESDLDEIEEGKRDWVKTLDTFYKGFEKHLITAKKEMRNVKREETPTDINCPKCGSTMNIKWGKNGQFLACSKYPNCTATQEFFKNDKDEVVIKEAEVANEKCPSCSNTMIIKKGKYGKFLACTKYPDCKTTLSFKIGIKCPKCKADLIEKSTKRGKLFYSCQKWPECSFSTWDEPVDEPCPTCGISILLKKTNKLGTKVYCSNKECSYSKQLKE